MVESAKPQGAVRPGGRTARTRVAVTEATLDELVEKGFDGLTVESVAVRSGVHKATVYRRWGSVEALIADVLDQTSAQEWRPPDTGSLEGDLRAIAEEIFAGFSGPRADPRPAALISAALRSDQGGQALARFLRRRLDLAAEVVVRAVACGELPEGTDADAVVRLVGAPLYYRLFLTQEPLTEQVAGQAAAAALVAAKAGIFAGAR